MAKAVQQTQQSEQDQHGQRPLDDLSYDLVTVLYEKSKALEAFDKYLQDAQGDEQTRQLFERMRQADEQFVAQLRDQIGQRFGQQGQAAGSKENKQSFYTKDDVVD